jgi:hypothetical protein
MIPAVDVILVIIDAFFSISSHPRQWTVVEIVFVVLELSISGNTHKEKHETNERR